VTQLAEVTRERAAAATTLLVPLGATEQHGPHLPVGVDHLVVAHVARAAAERVPVLVAPVVAYGASHHHLPYAGTLSLRSATLTALLGDIVASAAAWGVQRVLLLNGHGGNEDIARQVARDADLTVAAAAYWTLAGAELRDEAARRGIDPVPGHAGGFETSLMLALQPELVDRAALAGLRGRDPLPPPIGTAFVDRPGWVAALDGYTDDARAAGAAAGQAFLELAVAATARVLEQLAA
jgi:creatinine amidohydrolase